ncbi:putative secreted RxLR effector protein [Phytophthora cinnamomi]|uniref:putative secreted RxLR effector protein n=1 Tax=Phytophthora cinnamomi TaxID=4785 RepID=UPI0035594BD8|nr:putative secreted RxLR effector protein [Phytophthora cinnamomi]
MRLCSVLLVAIIALHAGGSVAFAAAEPTIPQLAIADRTQPFGALQIDSPRKRFLRTAGTAAVEDIAEDEERAWEFLKQIMAKIHPPTYIRADGTFNKAYVLKLVNDQVYRKETFAYWATANLGVEHLKNSLGNLERPGGELLVKEYDMYLKGL